MLGVHQDRRLLRRHLGERGGRAAHDEDGEVLEHARRQFRHVLRFDPVLCGAALEVAGRHPLDGPALGVGLGRVGRGAERGEPVGEHDDQRLEAHVAKGLQCELRHQPAAERGPLHLVELFGRLAARRPANLDVLHQLDDLSARILRHLGEAGELHRRGLCLAGLAQHVGEDADDHGDARADVARRLVHLGLKLADEALSSLGRRAAADVCEQRRRLG
mmetsp:Transcript_37452/g.121812  ORF Transcript_37452/g.121812 Transcript_37452/m.121812 type:complete len:218 (-) Transcript_37452:153-806(-)